MRLVRPAHLAWSVASAFACLTAVGEPALGSITSEARRVVDRFVERTGGAESLSDERTIRTKGRLEAFGLEGRFESWTLRPGHSASITAIGPFLLREACEGDVAWRVDQNGKFSALDGKELEEARASAFFENSLWMLPDQGGGSVSLARQETDSAGTYDVLEIAPPVGRSQEFWFDRKSGLLVRTVRRQDVNTVVTQVGDYQTMAGRLRPRMNVTRVTGMPMNDVRVLVDSVWVNQGITEDNFRPPGGGPSDVRFLTGTGPATLPFTYRARHVWMTVSVNGEPPADFLLDTGASITVIDSAYAAQHGIASQGALQVQGAGSSQGGASLSQIDSLRLDGVDGQGVVIASQKIAVMAINRHLEPFFWRPVAGVLGYDFMSRFVTEIDFDKERLTVYAPAGFRYAGKGEAVPLTLTGGIPVAKAVLDDSLHGEFRLDVGSGATLDLHSPFVRQHRLPAPRSKTIPVMGGGFGGTFVSTLTRMKKMAIGPFYWSEPLVALSGVEEGGLASEDYAGNIGNQVLDRFKCTFDYDRRIVYLEPGPRFAKSDRFSMLGIQLAKFGDEFRIVQVLPGSPAALAGMREDDRITTVDGQPVGQYPFDDLNDLFEDSPEGRKVRFELARAGKVHKITARLKRII